jgi:LPXTG-site transpeptidase (sortase) family protein
MSRKQIISLILIIISVGAFSFVFFRSFYYFPSDEVDAPDSAIDKTTNPKIIELNQPDGNPGTASAAAEKPKEFYMRLTIPSINVDAKITTLGLNAKGNMAAPKNFFDVGLYKYGTFPGDVGSAVIAGHVNNGLALPAVFANLKNLKPGDDVYVDTKKDTRLHFVVTGSKVYAYDSNPSVVFNDKSGKILNLITCSGTFIKELRTHDKRLVVTARLVE